MATETMITHGISETMDQSKEFSQPIVSSVWFLQPLKLYESVKPYCLAFTPDQQIPRENIQRQEVPIRISDMRYSDINFDLETNGFTLLTLPGNEQDLDWENAEDVRNIHYPKVVSEIERAIPGASCAVLRHQIRKRDVYFPKSTGNDYSYGQPLRAAHVDMVQSSAEQLIQEQLGQEAERILGRRYIVANVWHPLKGPNQDWPLALCDLTTLNLERDLEISDYVTPTSSREHCMVYAREGHKWWYLSNQKTTEAFLFCQCDPAKGVASGVPHASFFNPLSEQVEPRQSIEVVVVISFD